MAATGHWADLLVHMGLGEQLPHHFLWASLPEGKLRKGSTLVEVTTDPQHGSQSQGTTGAHPLPLHSLF